MNVTVADDAQKAHTHPAQDKVSCAAAYAGGRLGRTRKVLGKTAAMKPHPGPASAHLSSAASGEREEVTFSPFRKPRGL